MSNFQGIPIVIENPKGTIRRGKSDSGTWERLMYCDYGYVPGAETKGDGEDLDVYVGPDPDSQEAYMVEQLKKDGSHDEFKCMIGFPSQEEALKMYLKHYPADWAKDRLGKVYNVDVADLKDAIHEQLS
jgi:hypothetical protein